MKKLLNVIVCTLALNFLALAGLVGWLWQSGKLDRKTAFAIKDLLFPQPSATPAATTQPTDEPYHPTRLAAGTVAGPPRGNDQCGGAGRSDSAVG